jgi:MraZ protein
MLIGEYIHTLDPKKRLSLPAKFRKELGKGVVVTRGLDHCLWVYSTKEWHVIATRLAALPIGQADTRGFARFMFSGATEVDIDSAGRMLIPDFLKTFAGLENKVVLAGAQTRIEIWNEAAWEAYKMRIESQADVMAEKLGEIGIV